MAVTKTLLLKEIIERAELDRNTTRYVLDQNKTLDIPKAVAQGQHRNFSIAQAFRIANCSRLVAAGMSLGYAEDVIIYIAQQELRICGKYNEIPFPTNTGKPWILEIVSGRFVQIHRVQFSRQPSPFDDFENFYDVITAEQVDFMELPEHAVRTHWSLTVLAKALAR